MSRSRGRLYRASERVIDWCVRRRRMVVALTFAAFVAGVGGFALHPAAILPDIEPARKSWSISGCPKARPSSRPKRQAKRVETAGLRTRRGFCHHIHRRRRAALLPAARPAAQNQNFAQLLVMPKSIEARDP